MKALHDAHVALFSEYLDVNPLAFYRFHLTRLSYEDPRIAAFYDPVTDTVGDGYTTRVPLSRVVGRDVVEMAMLAARNGRMNAQRFITEITTGWFSNTTKIERNIVSGAKLAARPTSKLFLDVETNARGTVIYTGDGQRINSFDFDDLPVPIQASDTPETTPDGRPIREHNYLRLRKGYKR